MPNDSNDSVTSCVSRVQESAPNAERLDGGNAGWFRPGNTAALKDGRRSRRVLAGLMPEQAEARAALAERVAAIVGDLGGKETLSALAVGQVQRHAKLELVDTFLWENLQRHGPLTGKGHTRAALTAWLSVVDRLQKSAATLGLQRVARKVPSLDDYLRRRYGSQGAPGTVANVQDADAGDRPADGERAALVTTDGAEEVER